MKNRCVLLLCAVIGLLQCDSLFALGMGKPSLPANSQYLRLQLAQDQINTDDILIRFDPSAKTEYVFNEDAEYFQGFGQVNLYSFSEDGTPLAINVLPLAPTIIKLNVEAKSSGTYKLNMTQMAGIPMLYDVWLMDHYKNDSLDMKKSKIYTFDIDKNDTTSYGSTRFSLVIRQNSAYAYKLLDITAAKVPDKSQVEVDWKTMNEQDNTTFTVERSVNDGKAYDTLGTISSSGEGVYSFVDKSPLTGKNLYRLRQENNNDILYSNPVEVLYSDQTTQDADHRVNVYPNPVRSTINLAIAPNGVSVNTYYNIQFTDSSGLIVKQAASAQPSWQDNIGNLQPGIYFVQVLDNRTSKIVGKTKFIKL